MRSYKFVYIGLFVKLEVFNRGFKAQQRRCSVHMYINYKLKGLQKSMENRTKFQSVKNDNNSSQLGKAIQSIKKEIEEEKKFVSFASCPDK